MAAAKRANPEKIFRETTTTIARRSGVVRNGERESEKDTAKKEKIN